MRRQTKSERERVDEPSMKQVAEERERLRYNRRFKRVLASTVKTLIVAAACAILIASLWLPVLQIYGTSMTPTLSEGQIVVAIKGSKFKPGDLVAFYVGNKLLVKRCIGRPGEWIDIDQQGNVYLNDELLDEPYLKERAVGDCDLELPYQVPENRWFLMGDHRSTSVDSRSSTIGCVAEEQIVGKIVFRVWPLNKFGKV